MAGDEGLSVRLEVAQPVVAGLAALALLRISNSGAAPLLVSARLNLMEGDVSLVSTDPGGGIREIKGWQADTGLHRLELPPGQELVGALNLLDSPDGPIFPGAGEYRLAAHYTPSPQAAPVAAPPVPVSVVIPRTEAERELAALLADPAVRRGLVLGDRESAPQTLREIAGRFPGTLEARLAGLVSGAADGAEADEDSPPVEIALAIVALTNPYSRTGKRLSGDYAARYERRMAAGDGGSELEQALKLLRGEPVAGFGAG
jgi:hypothetical protein